MNWTKPSPRALLRGLGYSVLIAIADTGGVVALVTIFVRLHLIMLSQRDGWSYGAVNIGVAVFSWGLLRGLLAIAIEAQRVATVEQSAMRSTKARAEGIAQTPISGTS